MSMRNDWTSFGRVDEDGTVYVKTAAGERVVGSWQAGTPEEGLAHFARRFADLVTEVDLIEARLGSGAADPGHTITSLRRLRASLDEAHVVGDLDGLADAAGQARRPSPRRRPARPGPPATSPAPRRWPARPRWSRRPSRSPPSPPSGRSPATGCARSSTSGRPSRASTRSPTASCGSGTRPPGTPSPAAAAPTSPTSTPSASRPPAARTSWSPRPSRCRTPPTGPPRPTGSRS